MIIVVALMGWGFMMMMGNLFGSAFLDENR
jgi:hypothetical protein